MMLPVNAVPGKERSMALSRDERAALIERYRTGYDEVVRALEGITDAEWGSREGPGEWC